MRERIGARAGKIVARGGLFAAAWLVIAGTDPASWLIGIPAVTAASWAHLQLSQSSGRPLSPRGLIGFVPFFLWESLRGGVDIAVRVVSPRLPVAPGVRDYQIRLVSPAAQVLFLDCISLIPGTLSADLRGTSLRVHTLDAQADVDGDLQALERRVGALFGEDVERGQSRTQADPSGPGLERQT